MTAKNTNTNTIYSIVKVISWIVFLGLCIQTGVFIFNYVFGLFNPAAVHNLYMGKDLSGLFEKSKTDYSILFILLIVISGLKAWLFYWVVDLFRRLNFVRPFSVEVASRISKIGYMVLAIGIMSVLAQQYAVHVESRNIDLSFIKKYWDDYSGFLLMATIVFVMAQIFKKGIELQNENDLTL